MKGGDNMNQKEVKEIRNDSDGFVSEVLKNLSTEQLAVTNDGIKLGVALADVLVAKAKVPKRKKKSANE